MVTSPPRWLLATIVADGLVLGALIARGFGILPPDDTDSTLLIMGSLVAALYMAMATWLARGPSQVAYGLGIGSYMLGLMISGSWLVLLALGLGMSSTIGGEAARIVGFAVLLFVAQIALSVALYLAARRAGVESPLAAGALGAIAIKVAVPVLIFLGLGIAIKLDRAALVRDLRHSEAMSAAVFTVQGCAARWATEHPETGYPPSLAAMGPRGQKCLDEETAAGRGAAFTVSYEPTRDDDDRIVSFLVSVASRRRGNDDVYTGDTTGFIRNGAIVYGQGHGSLSRMRGCLELYGVWYPDQPIAASLAEAVRAASSHPDPMAFPASPFGGCLLRVTTDRRPQAEREAELLRPPLSGHVFAYHADDAGDWVLEGRPVKYGETAVRSYFLRRGGELHVTLLDRAATEDDPTVRRCPYPMLPYDVECVFLPDPPPVVAFVHDSVVTWGAPYQLAARDARDRSSAPAATLRFAFDCDVINPLNTSLPRDGELREQGEQLCAALSASDRSRLPRVVVRLWAIDPYGGMAAIEDTLRLVDQAPAGAAPAQ